MLASIGMGNDACMTKAVSDAIESADIILGASRMIVKIQCEDRQKAVLSCRTDYSLSI